MVEQGRSQIGFSEFRSKPRDISSQADYLGEIRPAAKRTLERLVADPHPVNQLWAKYLVNGVDKAKAGTSEEAWRFRIQLTARILPIIKGTQQLIKDGRMDEQMVRQKDAIDAMTQAANGQKISENENVAWHDARAYYHLRADPFLSYAEYLVGTAGERPHRRTLNKN